MILDWKLVSEHLDKQTLEQINANLQDYQWKYVAFVLFQENEASRAYIKLKQKKAEKFWIKTKLIEQTDLQNHKKALWIIDLLNKDERCIWILTQLPFNKNLQKYQWEILWNINPLKDIDGLGGVLFGLSQIEHTHFLPATVRAIFEILDFYKIKVSWKTISIIGQSNLIGKPLACECARRLATIGNFNEFSDEKIMKNFCKNADIIVSATWDLGLVDGTFLSEKNTQVLIDVWWWKKNNKPVGDFDFENIELKNHLYTPVPAGVWPVTVSAIFANLIDLQKLKTQEKN